MTAEWKDFLPIIVALIASLPGGLALLLQVKRYQKEQVVQDSDASNKFMEAAKGEATYALALQQRVMEANIKNSALETEVRLLREENARQKEMLAEQQETVANLQIQVTTLQEQVQVLMLELSKYKGDC